MQGRPALEAAHKTAEKAFIGKLRTNQPQLTPIQDDGRKRKFRVPRFVADNQAVSKLWLPNSRHLTRLEAEIEIGTSVLCDESGHAKFLFLYFAHVTLRLGLLSLRTISEIPRYNMYNYFNSS